MIHGEFLRNCDYQKAALPNNKMKKTDKSPIKGPSKAKNLKSYKFMPSKEYVAKKAAPKTAQKVASKPAPKVAAKPMKRLTLPEVTVTATRIKKAAPTAPSQASPKPAKEVKVQQERVRLYPKGEVSKKSVDSLRNIYGERVINKEFRRNPGETPMIDPDSSYRIKKLLKKSK